MQTSEEKIKSPKLPKEYFHSLEGKVFLITGGSRGIGAAIVEQLVTCGANVAFTFYQQKEAAETLVKQISRLGKAEVICLQADVRKYEQMQKVIIKISERYGRLDGVVNNAGIVRDKALMLMESADWADVLETNLQGVYNTCRAAIVTLLKQRSGRIVNISSVAGIMGLPRQVNYSASKAGIIGLTKALAKEVVSYGITVNAIAPGYIESDMTQSIGEKNKQELERMIPLKRFGKPEEVAGIVAVLLSDLASYITGQVIVVDGGLSG